MRKLVFTSLICSMLLAGCTPAIDYHGYLLDENQSLAPSIGVDTKQTIMSKYGSPTQSGTFDNNSWYYMSETQKRVAFYKDRTTSRKIVAIEFDANGTVKDVREYGLKDGKVFAYNKDITPTRGKDVKFLEQVFGSIGRAPIVLPNSDPNLPSSAGGPKY